jgi:hypothetical protein
MEMVRNSKSRELQTAGGFNSKKSTFRDAALRLDTIFIAMRGWVQRTDATVGLRSTGINEARLLDIFVFVGEGN